MPPPDPTPPHNKTQSTPPNHLLSSSPPHPQAPWPLLWRCGVSWFQQWGVQPLTLMCILARFSRLRVVWRALSGPGGTSCLSCSRYSLSLARLKEPETEL